MLFTKTGEERGTWRVLFWPYEVRDGWVHSSQVNG